MKAIDHLKREFVEDIERIPYQVIMELVISLHELCSLNRGDVTAGPNKYIFYFGEIDRQIRHGNEECFVSELLHDIIYQQKKIWGDNKPGNIKVKLQTDFQLEKGSMRIECYCGKRLLKRLEKKLEIRYDMLTNKKQKEWNAVEILNSDVEYEHTIMVVDDEPMLCSVLQRMLSKLGFNVVTAYNGFEAMTVFSTMKVDLVITDLRMPKMDGWQLMKRIKGISGKIPVVLITGYHSMYSKDIFDDSVADGYISKPFSFVQIKSLVEGLLEGKNG